jgi:hypothetical protein
VTANSSHGSAQDGRVDPVYPVTEKLTGDPTSPAHMTAYFAIQKRMIFLMNQDYLTAYGRMMDENEFPPVLRADIKTNKP